MVWITRTMSAMDRHTRQSKQSRPPDHYLPGHLTILTAFVLAICPIVFAQSITTPASSVQTTSLTINAIPAVLNLPPLNVSHPAVQLSFPPTKDLHLTFNLCSLTSNSSLLPIALVSTDPTATWSLGSRPTLDGGSGGTREGGYNRRNRQTGTWGITWDKGFGNWTRTGMQGEQGVKILMGLGMENDGVFQPVTGSGNVVVQLGASTTNPLHRLSTHAPLLGDTTPTTALLFSPLLQAQPHTQPTYPNYTLPPAQLPFSSFPSTNPSTPDLTLVLIPTGSSPTNDGLDKSMCAVRAANASTGGIADPRNLVLNRTEPEWMTVGGEEGFRVSWGVGDLVAGGSNYTAWVLDEARGELSKPVWLATKEVGFPCTLVRPSSFCPGIAYAAPLSPDPSNPSHPLENLPTNLTDMISTNLNAISTSLLSGACGRDRYSYTSSCADCYSAYRDWLCRVLIPRCGSGVANDQAPYPPSTVERTTAEPRLQGVPLQIPQNGYTELLPCLSTCHAVDRACPVNLNFRCPSRKHGADKSYAFIGDEADTGDGARDTGFPASDRWGNSWCNG